MSNAYDLLTTAEYEGFEPNIYTDTRGNPTIGHGFNLKDKMVRSLLPPEVLAGQRPITKDESLKAYGMLLGRARGEAINYMGQDTYDALTPQRQNIMTDMSYNLGHKLNEFKDLKQALINKDYGQASAEMEDSKWYGQTGRRSRALTELMK